MGPFQMTVLQSAKPAWMSARVFGPMSSPIHPSSMLLMSTTWVRVVRERERERERESVRVRSSKGMRGNAPMRHREREGESEVVER